VNEWLDGVKLVDNSWRYVELLGSHPLCEINFRIVP